MAITFEALAPDTTTRELLGVKTGTGVLTIGRDSKRYAWSNENLAYSVPAYRAAWNGVRPVQNLFSYSEDITNVNWIIGNGSKVDYETVTFNNVSGNLYQIILTVGRTYTISAEVKCASGTEQFRFRLGSATNCSSDITVDTTWKRYCWNAVADGTIGGLRNATDGLLRTVNVRRFQLEDRSGWADATIPSEYVSTNVAGSDGYAVFANENGNSVASNVVTEAVGTDLATVQRLSVDPANTNSRTYSNDQTNAVYTATNVTVAQDETGARGYPSDACTLTATAGNGTVIANAITAASANHVTRWFIKRKTGTGTIEITTDNGGTWTDVTSSITTDFSEVLAEKAAVTNPQIGIRIVTSADAVIVGNAEAHLDTTLEEVRSTGPIFTTTAAVSVTADEPTLDISNHDQTEGAWACEWTPSYAASEVTGDVEILSLGTAAGLLYYDGTNGDVESTDGTNTSTKSETVVAGTTYDLEVDFSTSPSSLQASVDAVAGSAESYDGAFTLGTEIALFRNNAYSNEMYALTFTVPDESNSIAPFLIKMFNNR